MQTPNVSAVCFLGVAEAAVRQSGKATERYAQQLHELDREAYLELKQRQFQRQHALP